MEGRKGIDKKGTYKWKRSQFFPDMLQTEIAIIKQRFEYNKYFVEQKTESVM